MLSRPHSLNNWTPLTSDVYLQISETKGFLQLYEIKKELQQQHN